MSGKRQISPEEDRRRRQVIKDCGGNVAAAARLLGVNRNTLYAFQREHGDRAPIHEAKRITLPETMRRVRAWLDCQTDREAARELGMKTEAYTRWRLRQGLPGKNNGGQRLA